MTYEDMANANEIYYRINMELLHQVKAIVFLNGRTGYKALLQKNWRIYIMIYQKERKVLK